MARCKLSDLSFQACRELLGDDAPLNALDRQIAIMSAKNCSAVEISMACHISTATVSRRRKQIIRRMGL